MVVMGRVAAAYGIRGWVKVQPYTEYIDSLTDYQTWWLGSDELGWKTCSVTKSQVHGKVLVAQFEDCPDRNEAERRKGLMIAVPRSLLPAEKEDEFYWSDLLGLKVVNAEGQLLGAVDKLLETGASQVLSVVGEHGELLIPFVGSFIVKVDLANKQIDVDWHADYSQ